MMLCHRKLHIQCFNSDQSQRILNPTKVSDSVESPSGGIAANTQRVSERVTGAVIDTAGHGAIGSRYPKIL